MERRRLILLFASLIIIISMMAWFQSRPKELKKEAITTGSAREVFLKNCAVCHGSDGSGTAQAQGLRGKSLAPDYIKKMIRTGNTVMPKFHFIHEPLLTDLAEYVHNLK